MSNISVATAQWEGTLESGFGTISADSSQIFTETPYSFKARAESQVHITTPEELIAAAHAACFSQAMSLFLNKFKKNVVAKSIYTKAEVTFEILDGSPTISKIHLTNRSKISDITEEQFDELANFTKFNCPVSRALTGVEITLDANLD
ncbi:OsmC family peroxiredoxin [Lactococcus lactis]|uniref:OsmC family peroxiredoxin n=1 Tax=Lactococcus lactis TaxID=1358 RepID=UPI0024A7EF26|nr:OsmC family peroxiredoxin [Lactococcus lactis]